jgi:hypothetical protein
MRYAGGTLSDKAQKKAIREEFELKKASKMSYRWRMTDVV